jgi:hypothetical protein
VIWLFLGSLAFVGLLLVVGALVPWLMEQGPAGVRAAVTGARTARRTVADRLALLTAAGPLDADPDVYAAGADRLLAEVEHGRHRRIPAQRTPRDAK